MKGRGSQAAACSDQNSPKQLQSETRPEPSPLYVSRVETFLKNNDAVFFPSEAGIAGEATMFCIALMADLVRSAQSMEGINRNSTTRLEHELQYIRVWADGFGVSDGYLDRLLELDEELRAAVFASLHAILDTVAEQQLCIPIKAQKVRIDGLLEHMTILVPDLQELSSQGISQPEPNYNESGAIETQTRLSTTLDTLAGLSRSLHRLTSALLDVEERYAQLDKIDTSLLDKLQQIEEEDASAYWRRNIQSKYPQAPSDLIVRLAKSCWHLYLSVKEGQRKREEGAHKHTEPAPAHDSTYGSLLQSHLAPSVATQMKPSLVQLLPRAPLHMFTSSAVDIEGSSDGGSSVNLKDRPKAPRPPVPLGPGISFECSVCCKSLKNIETTRQWRQHIFGDIRPYVCTFSDCPKREARFGTKQEWMEHEYEIHRNRQVWICTLSECTGEFGSGLRYESQGKFIDHFTEVHMHGEKYTQGNMAAISLACKRSEPLIHVSHVSCPFCTADVVNSARYISRHIGRHMEDCSLPVLTMIVGSDETDVSDCEGDSGGSEKSKERDNLNTDVFLALSPQHLNEVDRTDSERSTKLNVRNQFFMAVQNGDVIAAKLLLETGKVDVDSKDNDGGTPLSWAAVNGHEAVVKLLLETGEVDADSKDKNGQTPLSWAAEKGHEAVVKLLLETGKVDTDSKDNYYERTPLSWAAENEHEAVVRLLQNASHHHRPPP